MKKVYVFTNNYYYLNHEVRRRVPAKMIKVEAETILEAKKKVKEMGHDDMQFLKILVHYEKEILR